MLITDHNGVIEYVNPAFTRLTGYSAEEAIGHTPAILKSGKQDDAFYQSMWDTITGGRIWHGKVIDKRKDGSFFSVMLTISPIFDDPEEQSGLTHFIGIHADLSALEKMEEQFHQAQKMEAIGTLVGGIAHHFNNLLAGMTGNLYLARMQTTDIDVHEKLAKVDRLTMDAAEMIQQLLTFARKGMVSMQAIPADDFISSALRLMAPSVPATISLTQELCIEKLMIKGDARQLQQVLMNILNNSLDALVLQPEPKIIVRLQCFHADAAFADAHPHMAIGEYVHISVEDNGCGIAREQLKHLYEPFFTTKEIGQGTGLGLTMVYGAMQMHHGSVDIISVENEGTVVHMYMPLLKAQSTLPEAAKRPGTGIAEQQACILLVDDEKQIRETMAEVLEAMGYKVFVAGNGLEGFELFETHQQQINVAIMDMIMPLQSGSELAERIRQINADLPIIFLTGYDSESIPGKHEKIENSVLFNKPIAWDVLNNHIQQVLRG